MPATTEAASGAISLASSSSPEREQSISTQVLEHLVARALQQLCDLARAHARPRFERELLCALDVVPVEKHGVNVWIELHLRRGPLQRDHGSASLTLEARHHLGEHARQRRPQSYANRLRHAKETVGTQLAQRHRERHHVVDEMRRRCARLPAQTRRIQSTALTAKRDEARLVAPPCAPQSREASAKQPALEISVELLADELRQRHLGRPGL